jgi:Helix-turn-helix domain
MPDTTTASPYLDTEQAAVWLHISPRTMCNQRALGTGPRWHKAGGRILYKRSELESYIRNGPR